MRIDILVPAATVVRGLSGLQRSVVRQNIQHLIADPKDGHPSFHTRAKAQAWQHACPHNTSSPEIFLLLYRWVGGDPAQPADLLTVEDIVTTYSM
jgi:hypothetical protein